MSLIRNLKRQGGKESLVLHIGNNLHNKQKGSTIFLKAKVCDELKKKRSKLSEDGHEVEWENVCDTHRKECL